MPTGKSNLADNAGPSAKPKVGVAVGLPATSVTLPEASILRMQSLKASATYMFPAASTATSIGELKRALVPWSFTYPPVPALGPGPSPATVDVSCVLPAVINLFSLRMQWFWLSAMYIFPSGSVSIPIGVLKRAVMPGLLR
jgi:hypothetical protein